MISVILVPLFGLCHWLLNDLFLKRKREVDEANIRKYGEHFTKRSEKWLLLFPEGICVFLGTVHDFMQVLAHLHHQSKS